MAPALPMAQQRARLDAVLQRLERLDARIKQAPGQLSFNLTAAPASPAGGKGEKCGDSWISRSKTCRKGTQSESKSLHPLFQETMRRKAQQQAAAAKPETVPPVAQAITLAEDGPRLNGLKPTRALGSGAFGSTYQFDTPDGPVVVKVNGLKMGDPAETDPGVALDQQRENFARREFDNLKRAHAAGLAPEPIGSLVHLPDGRWSFAYKMLPGTKLTDSHNTVDLTPQAAQTLEKPQAAQRYVSGAIQLARRQAETGIIHGDLHGGNILVAPDGTPSLVDWAMTNKATNPWNLPQRSAAQRALDESYALSPLLTAGSGSSALLDAALDVSKTLSPWDERASKAEKAFRAVIDKHDFDWEENYAERDFKPGEFRTLMVEANRITREEGLPYALALRDPRVGLEAPLTPDVLARAAAARDAIFNQTDLDDMRQAIDRRFGTLEPAR